MASTRPRNTSNPNTSTSTSAPREKTFFEREREKLLDEISTNFEHVLINMNKLNRNLEGVVAVGNEFSSVEALWSQFESVMAKDPEGEGEGEGEHEGGDHEGEEGEEGREERGGG